MNIPAEDGEPIDLPSTSNDGGSRRPTSTARLNEDEQPGAPSTSPSEEARTIDEEDCLRRNTQERGRHIRFMDEAESEEQHRYPRLQPRKSTSSYAAPTRASQAKKNEKVEARPRTYSMYDNRRASPPPQSNSAFKNSRTASGASNHSVLGQNYEFGNSLNASVASVRLSLGQNHEPREMQDRSLDPMEPQTDDDNVAKVLRIWEHQEQGVQDTLRISRNERSKKEETEIRFEELQAERDEALDLYEEARRELDNTKDETDNMQERNHELEARIQDLEATSIEREKQMLDKLQSCKVDAENWRQKHDVLYTTNRELEERIETRNHLEPKLSLMEKSVAENEKLRIKLTEQKDELSGTQDQLKKTREELKEMTEAAEKMDTEAFESNQKLKGLEDFLCSMSEVMIKWAGSSSHEERVDLGEMDKLIQLYADETIIEELLVNTRQLLGKFLEVHEGLKNQIDDKKYEIRNILRAREEEVQDAQLSPGLVKPQGSLLHDRDGFESLYEQELKKRKAAEQKLQNIVAAEQLQSQLQREKEELRSQLGKVRVENNVLCKEAEEARQQADACKHEAKQSKLELDKRIKEFQSYIDHTEGEIEQYIKEYHEKAQDESHWEAANLHKAIEVQEREYKALKQDFDRSRRTEVRRQEELARLEKKCEMQRAHISLVEQAYLHGAELPVLPNLDYDDEPEDDSKSETLSSSPSFHSEPTLTLKKTTPHIPIPRYQYPDAIARHNAELASYRAQLKAKSEQEMLDFIFKAPPAAGKSIAGRKYRGPVDEIIEKVRKWMLGKKYPPSKKNWSDVRNKSLWERWQGDKWAAQCTDKRDIEMLRKRGLLREG